MRKGAGKIADYTLSKQLEESNFALIYRAQDKNGKDVVLKVAKEAKPELNELISREFQILSQFQHPNIVSVYDYGMTDGRAYFTQEYIPDKPIHECFSGFSEEFLAAMVQVINALGAFHDKGFIHCDLKPEHILYNKEKRRTVLIDFGFSGTPTQDVQMAGTLGYMAPEVLKGVCIDQRSDLYSLGVIIYEIIAGKQLPDPYEPVKDIPDDINKLLTRLVSKEPLLRPNAPELFQGFKKHITTFEVAEPLHKVNLPETGFVEIPEIAERIARAKGEALVITGDTGSGKTRHLQELKYKYLMDGHAVLFHTAKEQTTLAETIQTFIGLKELGLKEIEDRFQIFETLNQELLKFAEDKNVTILVDGLEELSDYGLQLFRYIGYGIKDSSIVLIGTSQPEQKITDLGFAMLELRPFTKDEVQVLLEKTFFAIADTKKTAQSFDFAGWLHKQSGGNPLYIVEILKSLYEQKVLHYKANQWHITSDKLKEIKLPARLDELLEARLGALDERQLKILRILSIADCPLDISIITDILGADVPVHIENLKNIGLLREEAADTKRLLNIPNQILSQIVTRGVDDTQKKSLARSLIQPLEDLIKTDDNYLPVLARLEEATNNIRKAREYYKCAGEHAINMDDYHSALEFYTKLVRYTEKANNNTRYRVLAKIAMLERLMNNYQLALKYYHKAMATNDTCLLAQIHEGIGLLHSYTGDPKSAMNNYRISLEYKETFEKRHSTDYVLTRNLLSYELAKLSNYREASSILQESSRLSKKIKDVIVEADILYRKVCIEWFKNSVETGLRKAHVLLKFAKNHRLANFERSSYDLLCAFYVEKNALEKAQECADAAMDIGRKTRNMNELCRIISRKSMLEKKGGNLFRAREIAQEALTMSRQLGDKDLEFTNLGNLLSVSEDLGNFATAIEYGRQAIASCSDSVTTNYALALALQRTGRINEARALLAKKNHQQPTSHYCGGLALFSAIEGNSEASHRMLKETDRLWKKENLDSLNKTDPLIAAAKAHFELGDFLQALRLSRDVLRYSYKDGKEYCIAETYSKLSLYNLQRTTKLDIHKQLQRFQEMGCVYDYGHFKRLKIESFLRMKVKHIDIRKTIEDVAEIEEIFESIDANLELERTKKLQEKLFPLIAKDYSQRTISTPYLDTFSNLAELINSHLGDTEFTQNLLDLLVQMTGAERGALFIKSGRTIKFAAGRNIDQETIKDARALSRTVVKDITKNRIIFTQNALTDPQFNTKKSVMVNQIHSLLCIPLAVSGAVIGALYLDSRVASGIFAAKDKDFLISVSKILASVIEKSQAFQHIVNENILFKSQTIKDIGMGLVIGKSTGMRKVYDLAEKVGKTDTPVFLRGETGTGKGMLARYIHAKSTRKNGKFIAINCSAIPETLLESELFGHKKGAFTDAVADKQGLLETAARGTVFLDEIANTSLEVQAKLLQAIEEKQIRRLGETKMRKIDVRFLFATNNHIEEEIKNGTFRKDLYYRINVISIRVPPLRKCKKDIPVLARFFLKRYNTELNKNIKGITSGAMKKLHDYNWPGNIRELQNVVERAVVLALGTHITSLEISLDPQMVKEIIPLKELEKKAIAEALELNNWNVSKTANQLGIGRVTLWRHIREHNMEK